MNGSPKQATQAQPSAPSATTTEGYANPDPKQCGTEALEKLKSQCFSSKAEAIGNCDSENDEGISSSVKGLSTLAVGTGVQSACTAVGKALGAANAAIAAYTSVCSDARNSCVSSCSALKRKLEREGDFCFGTYPSGRAAKDKLYNEVVDDNYTVCQKLDAKVQQGVAAVNNTIGTVTGAQNCAAQVDTTLVYCKQNPTAVGCTNSVTDCSNPSIAASNPICICARNPADASCSQANSRATDSGMGNADMPSSGLSGGTAGKGLDGGLNDVSWQGRDWKPGNSAGEDPGGDKGGRPIQEGGAGGSGGPSVPGSAAEKAALAVNGGLRGGGGSGGGGYFGSQEGGQGNAAAAGNQPLGNPDLRNFLPGGKYDPKTRGIAGVSGPDGITGPHSNIWQKINNRYQAERPKLIP
ncbi:MAG: hypothetical protein H7326_10690 [Bdellovibrionaceae bacterium]|nr:hypothetical protein [Pseudobdellovibrionaceae bacterium]